MIAGLGADTRVYNNIDLHEHEVTLVDWILPHKHDNLTTYAKRLIDHYHITPNSIVIGNSLGGMIAIEMAKLIPLSKVVLISSIKTINEAPWYFGFFRKLPLYKCVPKKLYSSFGVFIEFFFGEMNKADLWLFKDMLNKCSPVFLRWAMDAALLWKNETVPPNVYQIVGDNDLIFSCKRIKNATIIKGGTHIMIYDNAKQINKLLKKILKEK